MVSTDYSLSNLSIVDEWCKPQHVEDKPPIILFSSVKHAPGEYATMCQHVNKTLSLKRVVTESPWSARAKMFQIGTLTRKDVSLETWDTQKPADITLRQTSLIEFFREQAESGDVLLAGANHLSGTEEAKRLHAAIEAKKVWTVNLQLLSSS